MARVTRARIVSKVVGAPAAPPPQLSRNVTRMARTELDAREAGERLLAEAKHAADAILADARAKATHVAESAAREAAEAEQAKLAAQWLALRAREERSAATELDRSVALARVLAERLIGEAVASDPAAIAKLAQRALQEAQGARTARIEAHPDDVSALQQHLHMLAIAHVASVTADATLERGCLRLHTDLGTIDAQLRPQLERLARALRDALGP